jgi:hypothetical protein
MENIKCFDKDVIEKLRNEATKSIEQAREMKVGMNSLQHFENVMETHVYKPGYVSPDEFKTAMLMFFMDSKHKEGTEIEMASKAGFMKKVRLCKKSGCIFAMNMKGTPRPAIFLGISSFNFFGLSHNPVEYSSFYVFDEIGFSYLDYIITEKDVEKYQLLLNVKQLKFNFSNILSSVEPTTQEDLFENMEKLSDCLLVCSNGQVKTSRLLLSQRSKYFFVYFTRYSTEQNIFPMLDYKKEIVREYLRYLITNEVVIENIHEEISEVFEFANFIQDFKYMEYIYEMVYEMLTEEEKNEMTKAIKNLLYAKSKMF